MRRLKSARRVVHSFAAFPIPAGTEPEYPRVGEEIKHITVHFTWNGQEYESKFQDFDSEPIPESNRLTALTQG
jgi:hypothetical protein